MAMKKKAKEELTALQFVEEKGEKFFIFADDGFICPREDLEDLVILMAANIKNFTVPVEGESVDEADVVLEEDNEQDVAAPANGKRKSRPFHLRTTKAFRAVGESIGTHSLKFLNPRAKKHILSVPGHDYMAFPDSKLSGIVKMLFRPITVAGENRPTSIFEEIVLSEGSQKRGPLLEAAIAVLGDDLVCAFAEGMRSVREIPHLRTEGLPIVFLPNPEGGDIQVTPVSPAASYAKAREVFETYIIPHVKDLNGDIIKRNRRGSFTELALTTQPQNISSMVSQLGPRIRLNARFPDVMRQNRAEIMAYSNGADDGFFPRLREYIASSIAIRLAQFLAGLEMAGRKPEIVLSVRNMSGALANIAADHVLDVVDEARKINPKFRPVEVSLGKILIESVTGKGKWADDARAAMRTILSNKLSGDEISLAEDRVNKVILADKKEKE